jgi:hypothetical protein
MLAAKLSLIAALSHWSFSLELTHFPHRILRHKPIGPEEKMNVEAAAGRRTTGTRSSARRKELLEKGIPGAFEKPFDDLQ